jgi:hypothetical protein
MRRLFSVYFRQFRQFRLSKISSLGECRGAVSAGAISIFFYFRNQMLIGSARARKRYYRQLPDGFASAPESLCGPKSTRPFESWEFRRNALIRHVRFSPQLGKKFCEINAARASNAHNHQRLDARRGNAARICISHARVARALSGTAWL